MVCFAIQIKKNSLNHFAFVYRKLTYKNLNLNSVNTVKCDSDYVPNATSSFSRPHHN